MSPFSTRTLIEHQRLVHAAAVHPETSLGAGAARRRIAPGLAWSNRDGTGLRPYPAIFVVEAMGTLDKMREIAIYGDDPV